MGTCLAVIKVIGTTSLGLYAGTALTASCGSEIMKYVLLNTSQSDANRSHGLVKKQVTWLGAILTGLGVLSSTAFQLAYTGAPRSMKHPYLIYASLVFPLSSLVYYGVSGQALLKWFKLPELIEGQKGQTLEKKKVVSDLDNSVYKDLGETSADESATAEDEEIEAEIEAHLSQQTGVSALEKLHLSNLIVSGLSVAGFVIATTGVYGDF